MKSLHFYAIELNEKVGGPRRLFRFNFQKDRVQWIKSNQSRRHNVSAPDSEVRHVLRRMVKDPTLTFPVEID